MRRSRFDIIGEILSLAMNGAGKTEILYRANLSFKLVNRYLNLLIQDGMISSATGLAKYKTTEKGLEFLRTFKNLKGMTKNL